MDARYLQFFTVSSVLAHPCYTHLLDGPWVRGVAIVNVDKERAVVLGGGDVGDVAHAQRHRKAARHSHVSRLRLHLKR